ncbi:MAG: hypothetical protein WCL11_15520 [Verrucomicrobiota bacterium]
MHCIGRKLSNWLGRVLAGCICAAALPAAADGLLAQWTTTSRLLRLGEEITFTFQLPPGVAAAADLVVYPQYLERAKPGKSFAAGGDLGWLRRVTGERIKLGFENARASVTYRPQRAGNYLAHWRAGQEDFWRYFAVVEDDSIVLSFATFNDLTAEPTWHATGIPLDYRLPVEQFEPTNALAQKLLGYNRLHGDLVVPEFPDTPKLSTGERVKLYGDGMRRVRALLPDPTDQRSARLVSRHDLEPGYAETLARIGVSDHCGLQEANCKPWLGMPEFPYFASPVDCRKANQGENAPVVAHQWDFCGGFHFLGPVGWHYAASEGRFDVALKCLREGMDELRNSTRLSGHPVMITPLYDGVIPNPGFPSRWFNEGWADAPMREFVNRYQALFAFEFTRQYKLVFARSIDITDYYRRHYRVTPRTVFLSKTPHVLYDAYWIGYWFNYNVVITPDRIPWFTSLPMVRTLRNRAVLPEHQPYIPFKDPLSCEYILIEDQQRSIRFERECPNPIWWNDYTRQERGPEGSSIAATDTPPVDILRSQSYDASEGLTIKLKMQTAGSFTNYAIALWNVPVRDGARPPLIRTNAREHLLVRNNCGEAHLVLWFDLKPGAEISVVLPKPKAKRWEY